MWQSYLQPSTIPEALDLLARQGGTSRIVTGGTDLVVELQRGVRPTQALIDISALHELRYLREQDGRIELGALTTHNDVIASDLCWAKALPLAQASAEVGAPQIRTRGTIAGNLITASPANDTITALMALDAEVVLASVSGERIVPLLDFYTGVRRTVLRPDEMLRAIRIPTMQTSQRGVFLKLGLRRAQAISVVNVGIVLRLTDEQVADARITLGCVAPTVIHAQRAEAFLSGKILTPEIRVEAGRLAAEEIRPIDDLRGSALYRRRTVAALVAEGLRRVTGVVEDHSRVPVLLQTGDMPLTSGGFSGRVTTTINGRRHELEGAAGKTLLDALREDAGLTGTKEGCAEGECGACTVWLNGQAVMACLVLAPQAHNGTITTIEGLAHAEATDGNAGSLHPLQQAFIERGAVQCGYCIPGMLMAAAKLWEEHGEPTREQAQVALSGNICRCTGYRKIFDAVVGTESSLTSDTVS